MKQLYAEQAAALGPPGARRRWAAGWAEEPPSATPPREATMPARVRGGGPVEAEADAGSGAGHPSQLWAATRRAARRAAGVAPADAKPADGGMIAPGAGGCRRAAVGVHGIAPVDA